MLKSSKYLDFVENLKSGNICVFETDTVVGIGCRYFIDGFVNDNVKKIFDIKNRSLDKPLPWLISSSTDLKPGYDGVMSKLGFKHQHCIYHLRLSILGKT